MKKQTIHNFDGRYHRYGRHTYIHSLHMHISPLIQSASNYE